MATKSREINPEQISLFELPAQAEAPVAAWQNSETPYPVVYGEPGSFVGVASRATHLENALEAFGKRNQRIGFEYAAEVKPMRREIWGRYGRQTDTVLEGARRNEDIFLDKAKGEFWSATGFAALRGSGLMSEAEIDVQARKAWVDFSGRYSNPHNRESRDDLKKTYKKQAKVFDPFKRAA